VTAISAWSLPASSTSGRLPANAVKLRVRPPARATFAINGGPGASSAYLNLAAVGPWRLPLDGTSISPASLPARVKAVTAISAWSLPASSTSGRLPANAVKLSLGPAPAVLSQQARQESRQETRQEARQPEGRRLPPRGSGS
jgi:hypothetical protein